MKDTATSTAARHADRPREGWSLLWSASSLALGPQRLIIGFLLVSAIMVVGSVYDSLVGEIPTLGYGAFAALSGTLVRGVGEAALGLIMLDLERASSAFMEGVVYAPAVFVRHAPWRCGGLALVLLPVWTLFGGALSRAAVMEAARGQTLSVPESLAYALARRAALIGSYILPLTLIALAAGLLWLFGKALLTLPGLDIAGGVLYGAALVVGFVLSLLSLGLIVGFPLLVPSVAADSADITDAFQRAYAYLVERPFSLLVWGVALIAQGVVGVFVLALIMTTAINWTAELTGAASSGVGGSVELFAPMPARGELDGTLPVVAGVIGVWERAALAIVGAFALSYFFSASSLVYLRARQACDGQAIEDVWPRVTAIEAARRGEIEAIPDIENA